MRIEEVITVAAMKPLCLLKQKDGGSITMIVGEWFYNAPTAHG